MKEKYLLIALVIIGITIGYIGYTLYAPSEPIPTPTPTTFSMQVITGDIEEAIGGQVCVFLVVVVDEDGNGKAVKISATAPDSSVTVDPQSITGGQVAEVTVVPDVASTDRTLTVTIVGERDGLERTETITFAVGAGGDEPWPYAEEVRDRFIAWLAANHPEFGLTNETEWTGTIIRPGIMVVSYYLFFSTDWEMGVRWHVTRVPDDWAEIYLRKRYTEIQPSHGFKIDSYNTVPQLEPHAVDPPESVWR